MGARFTGAAGFLCVTLASGSAGARADRADQPTLDVAAISAEAGRWRTLLAGGRRSMPRRERTIVLDAGGLVLGTAEGGSGDVNLPPELLGRLRNPADRLIVVHNHPRGTGLSHADLCILGLPGVGAVVALGHDGSVYVASAGTAFDRRDSEDRIYRFASDRLVELLELHRIRPETVADHLNHLVSLALARGDWLDYHVTLARPRRVSYEARRDVLELVVNSTARELRELLAGDRSIPPAPMTGPGPR